MEKYLSKENLIKSIKYLLYATTITPAIMSGSFLFPYISARTVYFRVVIELAVLITIFLILRYKITIEKKCHYFFYVFSAFIIVNIISSAFSLAPLISWFSDIERMWGVFTLIHLFLFYLLLKIFFKGNEWKIFLNTSIVVSLYVAFYGIAQYYPDLFGIQVYQAGAGRIISTLGNSAYVAIYMVFNMFFAIFLLMKSGKKWQKYYYILTTLILFFAFNLASIRGTTLGLLAGLTIASLLYILLGKNKKFKISVALMLIVGSLTLFFAFTHPENKIVLNNGLTRRISTITISGGTVETRLIGWQAAWQGFKEKSVFGVGMENYHTVFNKYFNSDYYLYAPSEPYFDRSHNAWLDVLVMNGLIGFIIFLGFPIFIFYYLVKSYQEEKIKLDELLIFIALTITYFIHLIFVFDDLNSYIYFVVLFAFIEYRYHKTTLVEFKEETKLEFGGKSIIGTAVIIAVIVAMYNYNIKTLQACNATIQAYMNGNNLEKQLQLFDKSLEYDIVASRNITLSYVNFLTGLGGNLPNIKKDPQLNEAVKQALISSTEALEKEISKDSYNAMLYSRKAALDNISFIMFEDVKYAQTAIDASNQAIKLSEEHLQYYYTLADTYLITGNTKQAIAAIQKAIDINGRYRPNFFNLARVYFIDNQLDKSLETAKIFVREKYKAPQDNFFAMLADGFVKQGNINKAIEALELGAQDNEKNTQTLVQLAKLYLKTSQNDKSIATVKKITEIDPNSKRDSDYFINMVRQGRGEELLKQLEGK